MYYRVNGNVIENYKFNAPNPASTSGNDDNSWIYVAAIGGGVLLLALIIYFYMANRNGYKASGKSVSKKSRVGFKFF